MSHLLKMLILFLLIMGVVMGAYTLYAAKFSRSAKTAEEQATQTLQYEKGMQAYEEAMRADTYGGKTPEETLQLFVGALKKGDIDLASKYFELEQDSKSPDYMTRNIVQDALVKAKTDNQITALIFLILSMQISSRNTGSTSTVEYVSLSKDGAPAYSAVLDLNKYSGVWKIKSL